MTNSETDDLLNKHIQIPEIKVKHFDNSEEYVTIKKTRSGYVKVLKPEVIEEIKRRLEDGGDGRQ